jgi:hypothetical protein
MVTGLEGRIRAIAQDSLDTIRAGEAHDFVEAGAVPLPMLVIGRWPRSAADGEVSQAATAHLGDVEIVAAQRVREAHQDAAVHELECRIDPRALVPEGQRADRRAGQTGGRGEGRKPPLSPLSAHDPGGHPRRMK